MCRFERRAMIAGCVVIALTAIPGRLQAEPLSIQFAAAGPILETGQRKGGESLPELISLARRLSPEIAATILEAEAAEAAVRSAGALDDPELTLSAEDVGRTGSGLPGESGSLILGVEQRFPWWGKRDLQRSLATSDATRSKATARRLRSVVELRLKKAFIDGWLAAESVVLVEETAAELRTLIELALARHAIGSAGRGDISEAEVALNDALTDRTRLQAELASAKARINALLDRPSNAPLGDPAALPMMPARAALSSDALLQRALENSPSLAELRAEIDGANSNRLLAEASWYPDVTVGLGIVEGVSGEDDGYEASLGLTIPLQWGVRQAKVAEASARLSAAEHRLRAARRDLEASLAGSLNSLAVERFRSEILGGSDLRQAEAALEAVEAAYPVGRAEIGDVLRARGRIRAIRLEQLRSEAEQRRLLADIEFLLGGEL
jgi:outer membrane protein TolC